MSTTKILVVDNYDSFVYTLVGYLQELGAETTVVRNDDVTLAEAALLGAPVSPGVQREWGGYSGYFTDPDGFRWEIAVNPGETGEFVLPS